MNYICTGASINVLSPPEPPCLAALFPLTHNPVSPMLCPLKSEVLSFYMKKIYVLIIIGLLISAPVDAGDPPTVVKIPAQTVQRLVRIAFPLVLEKEIDLPIKKSLKIVIEFSNPRINLMSPEGTKEGYIRVLMHYRATIVPLLSNEVEGETSCHFYLRLSDDHRFLLLHVGDTSLDLIPSLEIPLDRIIDPVKIRLDQEMPLTVRNRDFYMRPVNPKIRILKNCILLMSDIEVLPK
jgi:hypothetical protein